VTFALAVSLCVIVQAPPVVLAHGPARDVIVVVDGKAWEVRTTELVRVGVTPPAPPAPAPVPNPAPDPEPEPEPDTPWSKLGRSAPIIGTVRAKLAAHYSAFGQRAARGEWATVQEFVNAEGPAYLAAIGEDKAITADARKSLLAAYEQAWKDGNQTPAKMARLWIEYGRGLGQAPEVTP
jgi:hypothetical protein